MKPYFPKKGDFIAVSFDPQSAHEQKGPRPALVVNSTLFNEKTGLAMVCPLATTDRGYPFHIPVRSFSIATRYSGVHENAYKLT